MFTRFFIDRPIFAAVLSIVITLAGSVAVFTLPIAQFPQIAPPTVRVQCNYPGASAMDVAKCVAAPIEERVNGVEGIMYMSSQCTNDGTYNLTVTFKPGVNLNMAQVLVQNRVALAVPSLPEVIRQTGVTAKKQPPDILMGLALTSPDGRYDQLYLSNYAVLQVRDELARIPGIAEVMLLGQRDYSMRIWLDPNKLAHRGMAASDVVQSLREENMPVATGAIGRPPVDRGAAFERTMSTTGRLAEIEQFENIILRASRDGRVSRLKDVARIELGAKSQDTSVRYMGMPTVFIPIFQLPDANALEVRDAVGAKMEELSRSFPEGLKYTVAFDTTPYTRESIKEVLHSLEDSVILVALVVLVFLQNWRSAIIPLVAVPVAIIGAFAVMAVMHFSLNNLTLFGLVLAIGIVVDDAIVVVEAVEHHIEHGLAPREATIKAMEQVSGPVIAVGLVLTAVFVPCAFISGIPGAFFRQFALTIAVSTIISAFNSLTLSPALAAVLIRPREKGPQPPLPRLAFAAAGIAGMWFWGWPALEPALRSRLGLAEDSAGLRAAIVIAMLGAGCGGWLFARWPNLALGFLFDWFNRGFALITAGYTRLVGFALPVSPVVLVLYGLLLWRGYVRFEHTPRGFVPSQDMGYLLVSVQLDDSASLERTDAAIRQLEAIAAKEPGIRSTTAIIGQSFVLNAIGSNFATVFFLLKDYADRRDPELYSDKILGRMQGAFSTQIADATAMVFPPPPVRGVGRAGGFMLMVEDRNDVGVSALQAQTDNLVAKLREPTSKIARPGTSFRANVPQLHIEPNARECMTKGVSLRDFADTLQVYEGSLYVNDFNLFGRTWQVVVQAEPEFRNQIDDLNKLKVRNQNGAMVPLGALCDVREIAGPLMINRYNMYPAASIMGAGAGISSGEAIDRVRKIAEDELPQTMAFEWSEMSYLELAAANTAMTIFVFAVLMVFLVLAAQYESWSLPLAIILVVPTCIYSALVGVNWMGLEINIFTQVGFVVLVGLASKNAILIVEYAKQQRAAGRSRREATLDACRLRLRPIVMTSLAFILGVVPLVVSRGAGAEMRRALGTAVFSGMVGVTLFGLALTPIFFSSLDWLANTWIFGGRIAQRISAFLLDALTFRGVRHALVREARRKLTAPPRPASQPPQPGSQPSAPEPDAIVPEASHAASTIAVGETESFAAPPRAADAHPPRGAARPRAIEQS